MNCSTSRAMGTFLSARIISIGVCFADPWFMNNPDKYILAYQQPVDASTCRPSWGEKCSQSFMMPTTHMNVLHPIVPENAAPGTCPPAKYIDMCLSPDENRKHLCTRG